MNIVLCTDDNYVMACSICITSIFENNKNLKCNIYILSETLSDNNVAIFSSIAHKYNQKIIIKIIEGNIFNGLKVNNRFRKSIYFRFLIPNILKNEKKALYLDSDIIVDGSIKALEEISIENYACAAVEDQCGDDIRNHNRIEIDDTIYFNSGVLLMNLDYWRKNNIAEKCIDFIYNNPEKCLFPDQDALNVILHDKIKYIGYTYNFQALLYAEDNQKLLHRSKWKDINQAKQNSIIIHYTCDIKPWFIECKHPRIDRFLYYKSLSPFKDNTQKSILPLQKRRMLKIKSMIKKSIRILSFGLIKIS